MVNPSHSKVETDFHKFSINNLKSVWFTVYSNANKTFEKDLLRKI